MDNAAFNRIRGSASAKELLHGHLTSGHVHHAYLFAGPAGVGKTILARAWAEILLSQSDPQADILMANNTLTKRGIWLNLKYLAFTESFSNNSVSILA